MDFAKSAPFKTIADFPLRSTRPYIKYCSYPNDDTETATFDLTVALHVWLNDAVVRGSAVVR